MANSNLFSHNEIRSNRINELVELAGHFFSARIRKEPTPLETSTKLPIRRDRVNGSVSRINCFSARKRQQIVYFVASRHRIDFTAVSKSI